MENILYSSPVVNCHDLRKFPIVSQEFFELMEQEFSQNASEINAFPFVRKTSDGTPYIDIYVWDVMLYPACYERFVLLDGHRLPSDLERKFLGYFSDGTLRIEEDKMDYLNKRVSCSFPSWHFAGYSNKFAAMAFQHMYFASHRSGANVNIKM